MDFQFINFSGYYFLLIAGIIMVIAVVMKSLSKNFVTLHVFVRSFKMLDLEFPASALELSTYVNGIFDKEMPLSLSRKSARSLREFLLLNFFFLLLINGMLFLLCLKASVSASFGFEEYLFYILAWGQILSFACGLFRNIFFLRYIRPDTRPLPPKRYKLFQIIEVIKWALPLSAGVSIVSFFIYIWFSEPFDYNLPIVLGLLIAEAVIILLLMKLFVKSGGIDVELYRDIGN